jgi:hypothetical protein
MMMSSEGWVIRNPDGTVRAESNGHTATKEIPTERLEEIFRLYEPVSVGDDYIVVQPKRRVVLQDTTTINYNELGTTGQTSYGAYLTDEYNADLRGLQGLRRFDQMRKGDGAVASSLMLAKAPTLGARWYVEPASDSTRDQNVAKVLWANLNDLMTIPWSQVLYESLLMLDFGYYFFEIVWEEKQIDGENRIAVRKLAPRHPMNVLNWNYDRNGGPVSVEMVVPDPRLTPRIVIPIEKSLVFTHKREAGSILGVSALRSSYKHWYLKDQLYKIDAIQKERHGIGIPIIKLPPNFTTKDVQLADQMGRNLRVNEKAHVVLPALWEITWAKIEGYPVNAIESIEHHNKMIRDNIIGGLISKDTSANASTDYDLYISMCRYIADTIRDTVNLYLIPRFMDYNYSRVGRPQLKYWFVPNLRDLSFTLRNLVGADLLRADDKLEELLRDLSNLPDRDKPSDRTLELRKWNAAHAGPQLTPGQQPNPAKKGRGQQAGLPRQSPSPSVGTGQSNTGGATNNSA